MEKKLRGTLDVFEARWGSSFSTLPQSAVHGTYFIFYFCPNV